MTMNAMGEIKGGECFSKRDNAPSKHPLTWVNGDTSSGDETDRLALETEMNRAQLYATTHISPIIQDKHLKPLWQAHTTICATQFLIQ